ncbi:hypothetical protein K6U06_06075 [Acidiferrimicrobium sp. IK]|uniref:hypothetical protein n=1 Tax=Acidiferrimicrobium sp. IK TaxID=2871700 RepID=UPI0021CB35B0|nr:hypothetical protein [Acidiferrimicrobium sp. IK]MCU4183921.1 hypothetical protein [Acidiferrimicrobium sp. IK]
MADDDPPSSGSWDPTEFGVALARWASERAADESAAARSRERWLRRQAGEAATLTGVLIDLAERGVTVTVTVRSGSYTGRVVGVGRDFCLVAGRAAVLVALGAVVSLAPLDEAGGSSFAEPGGDREAPLDVALDDVLGMLAAELSPVRMVLSGGASVAGSLSAAGEGILTCRLEGAGRRHVTVVTAAVEICIPQ